MNKSDDIHDFMRMRYARLRVTDGGSHTKDASTSEAVFKSKLLMPLVLSNTGS